MAIVVALAILWVINLATTTTRNWRFAAFLAASSPVALAAAYLDGVAGNLVAVAVVGLVGWASLWPERLGLGSHTPLEIKADAAFRALERAIDNQDLTRRSSEYDPILDALAGEAPTDPWKIAARLYRRYLARLTEPQLASRTQPVAEVFRNLGHAYWVAGSRRRVIGGRRSPSTWAEDGLLRCLWEEFEGIISTREMTGTPIDPNGPAASHAVRVIEDVRACYLVNPAAIEVRNAMVATMEVDLELAKGDRSREAIERQLTVVEAMNMVWLRLTAMDPRSQGAKVGT